MFLKHISLNYGNQQFCRKLKKSQNLSNLSQHSSDEKVMRAGIFVDLVNGWIWIKLLIVGEPEKSSIRVETSFEKFGQEFSEEATAVNPGFVQPGRVGQPNAHLQPQVRLWNKSRILKN